MIWVLLICVGLWVLGHQMGVSTRVRWIMIGVLYLVVLLLLLMLAETHPIRLRLGASAGEWAVFGALIAAIFGYRRGLIWLKARAKETPATKTPGTFAETELERYARHIMLREVGGLGQKRLKQARVLVVGAGGLGSPALMYLAAAGVGTIGLIDDDVVEGSNLQRQIAHSDDRIGMPKVFSAAQAMAALNPFINLRPYHRRLDETVVQELVAEYDLVLDGTDNFATRYLVNAACVAAGKPLISGALTQWEGQLSVFDPTRGAPCYQCVFPEAPAAGLAPSCAEAGVIGPLPGVVGSMMAVEAIKAIAQAGNGLINRMFIYDALYAETRVIKIARREDCEICGVNRN